MENTVVDLLRQVPIFRNVEAARLEEVARRTRRRRFAAGEALLRQGEWGRTLYLVVAGRVRIQKITAAGEVVHLAHRGPGEHFGELALFDDQPRMADAVTATPCDLLMLDRDEFIRCLEESPRMALAVMASLAGRLREAADALEEHQQQDVLGRLCRALLGLAAAQGSPEAGGAVRIEGRVTHQALAEQIGATRETVSRALAGLRAARAVRADGHTLVVLNPDALERHCRR